jgi:tetratricopeptide (TPR) repeat protein
MTVARVAVLVLACVLGLARVASAQEEDLEMTARTHFARGEYKEALDIYARLYVKKPHPTYLRNMGRCYQNLGEPKKAIGSFREYLRKAQGLDAQGRAEIEGYIQEMEALESKREVAPPSGAPPVQLVTPPRSGAPPPDAPAPADATPEAAPGVAASLEASPVPAGEDTHAPIYTRWWFWAAIAALAAGGAVAAIALSSSSSPSTPEASTTLGTKSAGF